VTLTADPEPRESAVAPPTLSSLLAMTENPDGSVVEYVIGGQQLTGTERETAAQLLADDAMQIRCGQSPALARWRARRDGGPPEAGTRKAAVEAYAEIGFGLPAASANDDHLQGHVAELLWNRLIEDRRGRVHHYRRPWRRSRHPGGLCLRPLGDRKPASLGSRGDLLGG
jgi:hypothetical protein